MSSSAFSYTMQNCAVMDRAMGHGGITSGGRGKRAYEREDNLSKFQRQKVELARKQEEKQASVQSEAAKAKYLKTVEQMKKGELDYM